MWLDHGDAAERHAGVQPAGQHRAAHLAGAGQEDGAGDRSQRLRGVFGHLSARRKIDIGRTVAEE